MSIQTFSQNYAISDLPEELKKDANAVVRDNSSSYIIKSENQIDSKKKMAMKVTAWLMGKPALFDFAGKVARKVVPILPNSLVYNKGNIWGRQRDLPKMPAKSFKEMFKDGELDD